MKAYLFSAHSYYKNVNLKRKIVVKLLHAKLAIKISKTWQKKLISEKPKETVLRYRSLMLADILIKRQVLDKMSTTLWPLMRVMHEIGKTKYAIRGFQIGFIIF